MNTICSEEVHSVVDAGMPARYADRPDRPASLSWLWSQSPQPAQAHRNAEEGGASSASRPSGLRRGVLGLLRWIERRRKQRESRDAFSHLLALDDTLLQDIGVTRAEVERAAGLPLAQDAAQALYDATHGRHGPRV